MVSGKNIGKFLTGSTFFVQFSQFFRFYFSLLLEVELRITKKLHQGRVKVVIQIGPFLEKCTCEKHREIFEYWVHFFLSNFFSQFFHFLFFTFIGGRVKNYKKVTSGSGQGGNPNWTFFGKWYLGKTFGNFRILGPLFLS